MIQTTKTLKDEAEYLHNSAIIYTWCPSEKNKQLLVNVVKDLEDNLKKIKEIIYVDTNESAT